MKINLTGDEFGDIEHIADPEKEGDMNYGIIVALCNVATDKDRAVHKLKHCFYLMTKNHVDFDDLLRMKLVQEDEIIEELEKLDFPMVLA